MTLSAELSPATTTFRIILAPFVGANSASSLHPRLKVEHTSKEFDKEFKPTGTSDRGICKY
jgi:hypothetical protein